MALPMHEMLEAVKQYRGLPHRCQLVGSEQGVQWINDSKATNVGACIAAIEGLVSNRNIILIAGGVGKNQDFSALTPIFDANVKAVILIGQDARQLADVTPESVIKHIVKDMTAAVIMAKAVAGTGDIVLLSPACASFDMYNGYSQRGDVFIEAVEAHCHE